MKDLAEQAIFERYMQLEPQGRRPTAFWTIVVAVLPALHTAVKPPTKS